MHITRESLASSTDEQLDELHNYARGREKHHHRVGNFGLSASWRSVASTVLLYQFERASSTAANDARPAQLRIA